MNTPLSLQVITLFPEIFKATEVGILGKAQQNGLVNIQCWNPRDYSEDNNYRRVDDRPYGGGPGMVMMAKPLRETIKAIKAKTGEKSRVLYLTPQGKRLDQALVKELHLRLQEQPLILLCGRYEGIDERLIDAEVDEEYSIGDYVLSGGEFAALVLMDAIVRLIPGALGHEDSAAEDSFSEGLLDCPHYTRPEVEEGQAVPPVLLSGNHEAIRRWRMTQSLLRTLERRPDLLEKLSLTKEQKELLLKNTGGKNHEQDY